MIRPVTLAVLLAASVQGGAQQPASQLAVRTPGASTVWWSSPRAPRQWGAADSVVARALRWQQGARGIHWAELSLAGSGEGARTRLVIARLDPRLVALEVLWGVDAEARPAWTIAEAPRTASFAVNAGQFVSSLPWGWVVAGGRERLPPGRGPLSSALVITRDGAVRMIDGDTLGPLRRDPSIRAAFQSYPTLLHGDGTVPAALFDPCAINCSHRDARLALGIDRAGRLLVAMTRFDAAGEALGFLPLGLTVPEMAAVMGALGARQAVLLDGGISAQMLVRDAAGTAHTWRGMRRVPLALTATGR